MISAVWVWSTWLVATPLDDTELSLGTPSLPPAPAVEDRAGRRAQPEILYINFDGAVLQSGCGNDARYDCSTLADLFDGYVGPYRGNLNQKMNILQATRNTVADFGVQVVTERPPDDVEYTMVIYGDLGEQSFAGIAPYIDCEDLNGGDTSFTAAFSGSNTGSTVILQEAAHTWGLEHVDSEFDVLNPFKSSSTSQKFLDQCLPIVANTDLEQTAGSCNQMHTRFCPAGQQNSYQEMLYLFGPHVPDVEAPQVDIQFPEDGARFVLPTAFALRGEVTDNLHPQFYTLQVYNGDELIYDDPAVSLDLMLTQPPPGDYDLRVVLIDSEGNAGVDRVCFRVLPVGSELPEDEGGEPTGADDETGCRIGGPRPGEGAPSWWAVVAVAGLRSRRR